MILLTALATTASAAFDTITLPCRASSRARWRPRGGLRQARPAPATSSTATSRRSRRPTPRASRSSTARLYVNAYNAYTLQLMLDEGPPKSITDLDGGKVWDTRRFVVAAQPLTSTRWSTSTPAKIADGRVHAVVNCASKGCPPLPTKAFSARGVDSQLDAAVRIWAMTNAFSWSGETIRLSKIFDWYRRGLRIRRSGRPAGRRGQAGGCAVVPLTVRDPATKDRLLSGAIQADWQDCDWSLNRR